MLKVKEIFGTTIEGEGLFTGTKAIFIRLSGCNIWNGKAETKAKSACPYCDTDFVGGKELTESQILDKVFDLDKDKNTPLINLTGGEPLLQDIDKLCGMLISCGYKVNIETNGTKPLSSNLKDLKSKGLFVTCSPKVKNIKLDKSDIDCLKVLYPHNSVKPEDFKDVAGVKYLQPIELNGVMDYETCIRKLYSMSSDWKLSVQLHKIIGVE